MVLSLGDEYNLEDETLTILINVPPAFLENNPIAHPRDLTPAVNNLFIARLYQLTHPGIDEENSRNFAASIIQNGLFNQKLFEITKLNGN